MGYTPRAHQPQQPSPMPSIQSRIDDIIALRAHAQNAISHTQHLVTKQCDKTTKFRPFTKGQKVWLEGTNLKLTHPTTKLAPRRYGPFIITCILSPVVYQLMLPPQWKQKRIHDVFHASLLTPYQETPAHSPNFPAPPPDVIEGETEYEVECILDSHRTGRGRRLEYLVR